MQIGIVGLPNSTKTTIFNALTRRQEETAVTTSGAVELHTAVVEVPDPRVDRLTEIYQPRKTTYARVQYNDIAGLRIGASQDGLLSGQLLNTLSQSDALLHVVRAFEDERVPHPSGSVDPARDLGALELEFLLSDLQIVERRLERLGHDLDRKGAYDGRDADLKEQKLLAAIKESLEEETPIRALALSSEDEKTLRGFRFLTAKPQLIVLNVGDDGSVQPEDFALPHREHADVICLRGALEMEISQLPDAEAEIFLSEYGISEPGLNRMIRASYQLLGLQSFFTVGEDEVRAWTIPAGAKASEAAGVIHSDLQRGFIRAETVAFDDLVTAGSQAAAKKLGQVRLEGKEYLVQDGDIINFRFNV